MSWFKADKPQVLDLSSPDRGASEVVATPKAERVPFKAKSVEDLTEKGGERKTRVA